MASLFSNDDLLILTIIAIALLYLWDQSSKLREDAGISSDTLSIQRENIISVMHSDIDSTQKSSLITSTVLSTDESVIIDEVVKRVSIANKPSIGVSAGKVLPYLPGCEPDGAAAKEMLAKYPDLCVEDAVRFLVARKGSVVAASEMYDKYLIWRSKNFPLKKEVVKPAYDTRCMFFHGFARDGSPVIYFRLLCCYT